ncbi:SusC/RagA family TonB-linked outer membrane protein [Aquimarina sp. AD1]|uniref:SusC/RagA family TonB-linked outer membrane protein n=1 Tax=Aquimarina sp. (strain AD1) TaxID=1714848 RepID=UPI000E546C76|nr:SusC/RagA family TonB-linked outer membrane protein [Aquimarina sp. AD1]AXT56411.1 SusC/RagA family TonB-linked outer membrane protein [Aquimarina sp. AD1]RKN36821.1 SusC/RagA family TonB-linked outer membrane protein [Aquimarina sp. AD1]
MRTKFRGILTLLLAFVVQLTFAQEKTISGNVTDNSGLPLPGVNIVVKGTSKGTQSDFDGNYTIQVNRGAVLSFSYLGFTTKEVVVGDGDTVNVQLAEDAATLEEVVVTAQGIRKAKKALGYAVATIASEDIASQPQTDVVRSLTGKAPGVNITQTSGLSGTGTNIIIRGYSSINGNNQPLFVVDGVPFNSDTNSSEGFTTGGASASSRFLDIDPNNIKEISILKGLSATTLYGQAGRNGVVLVTTKSGAAQGGANKKFEITFNQSYFSNEISDLPDFQDSYGNGFNQTASAAFSNWGADFNQRIAGDGVAADGTIAHPYDRSDLNAVFPEFVGARYDYRPYDNIEPFFRTGNVVTSSLSVSSGNDTSSYNISVGRTDDEGFVIGNKYQRLNFSAGGSTKLSNKFTISSSFNYVLTDLITPPTSAGFGSNANDGAASLFANILYTPRSIDLFNLPFQNPVDGSSVYYRTDNSIQNPRWTQQNARNIEDTRRFFGNFTALYEFNDWLNLSYRLSLDSYVQDEDRYVNKGGTQAPGGFLSTFVTSNTVWDHTLSLNFDKDLNDSWGLSGNLGFNPRREERKRDFTSSTEQFVFGLINHQNFEETTGFSDLREFNIVGAYLSATVDYNDYLFLNVAGRNDWYSSLQKENRSIFYPSASLSFVPTSAFEGLRGSKAINYLKLRLGYGSSAGFPDPYATVIGLDSNANTFIDPNGGAIINSLSEADRLGNANLKPELITELEAGVEAKLFDNRVSFDVSVYDKRSKDLILNNRFLDPSTGNTVTSDNVAEVSNQGLEVGFGLTPIRGNDPDDFRWDISGQYTINENIVESLGGESEGEVIAGFIGFGNYAIPGEAYGVIFGTTYQRDDNGNRVVGADGNYIANPEPTIIGDPNADWRATLINNFSYKGFTLGMQWEYTHGGDIYSTTAGALLARGLTTDTDFDRTQTFVLDGVQTDGSVNTVQINATDLYFNNIGVASAGGINERGIYDATTLRLREATLGYNVPSKFLDKTPFGRVSISFIAQNMWYKAFNFPKGINFDPEVTSLGVGNGQGFDYLTGPTAKRYGFNLSLTF